MTSKREKQKTMTLRSQAKRQGETRIHVSTLNERDSLIPFVKSWQPLRFKVPLASDIKGNEVILKYHWAEGLIGTPAAKILPVKMNDDPIPFIKILDPAATFTLQIRP